MPYSIINGDFYEELLKIRMNTVDMILTDLPYNTTKLEWDNELDLKKMWDLFNHVLKDNGVVVMTSIQPFTTQLINSNPKQFKQMLVWLKTRPSNVFNAKKMFMNWHEDILVFYNELPTFNPQMVKGEAYKKIHHLQEREKGVYNKTGEKDGHVSESKGERYPKTVLEFSNPNHNTVHPTQKPVELFEYLIKTYSNEGDTILDCCAGSGTTGEACKNTNREYTLIEKEEKYYEIIKERLK
jgi:site-specific DNA-methyltransferase (adenine-specific)